MFLFEKSVIGAYCNRLYDFKEKQGPVSCQGQNKANSAGKNLNVTNINTKAGPPNHRTCLSPNSSFLYESKRPRSGEVISFDYVSAYPYHPLHFYKLRMVVCVIVLSFLNTSSLD